MVEAAAKRVISLSSVNKSYQAENVVHDVSLEVNSGECIVLIGHNGAGKTSLMKLMLGLTRPTSGTVTVLGENPATTTAVEQRLALGYLPESVAFYEAMTGTEVLAFYARLKNSSNAECKKLLDLVGLSHASKRRVSTYSKGMRQRLGLAQAMLGDPKLLFLDEPTTGLDPILRQHFYDLIDDLHQQGATSIISSHALNEVEARATRFVIMRSGHVVASGSLAKLYQQAALPIRFELCLAEGKASVIAERLGSKIMINHVDAQKINLSCVKEEKMSLIRTIMNLGDDVEDIEITPPRLDEVYNHFMDSSSS